MWVFLVGCVFGAALTGMLLFVFVIQRVTKGVELKKRELEEAQADLKLARARYAEEQVDNERLKYQIERDREAAERARFAVEEGQAQIDKINRVIRFADGREPEPGQDAPETEPARFYVEEADTPF